MGKGEELQSSGNHWNSYESAEGWKKSTAERMEIMRVATKLMLDAASITEGDRVLDIAAGTGDQSIAAAKMVGESGSVLATDLSANMLHFAKELADHEGLSNVETMVLDAQHIELEPASFDSVISRHGLMFIPDLNQALTGIYRVLRPDGKFAGLVWSKPDSNPTFSIPLAIIYKHAGIPLPQAGGPGVFSLSDPQVIHNAFHDAGFIHVFVQPIPLYYRAPSAAAFVQAHSDASTGPLAEALARFSETDREQIKLEIIKALQQFEDEDGFVGPSETLLIAGQKPSE